MAKSTSHQNRGLGFEKSVEKVCNKYQKSGVAIIHKVPTEFTVIRAGARIVSAFPKKQSDFVDFVGNLKGQAIALECKETQNKTRFPFSNIKDYQIKFLDDWKYQGGLSYYLIRFSVFDEVYLVESSTLHNCIDTIGRESAPYDWFKDNSILLDKKLDFVKEINKNREVL